MIVLRPIRMNDLEATLKLSQQSSLGLTTLPKDVELLEKKIAHSITSFQKQVETPDNEYYLFVLEDTDTSSYQKSIIGVSAISSTTGEEEGKKNPLYFFRRETVISDSPIEKVVKNIDILTPVSYVRGPSEICSLFLDHNERKKGLGKLLSLGRFLFVAQEPDRFTNSFFAELRGVIENNHSPFWDGLGRHFLDVSFAEALELLKYGRHFISDFLPKYPVYVALLSYAAQKVIGVTHPHTEPAANMLISQGFSISDEIDIFDGGPKFRALKKDIRTISDSKVLQVTAIQDTIPIQSDSLYLLSNEQLEFRACIDHCIIENNTQVQICSKTAEILQLDLGSTIRLYRKGAL